MPWTSLRQLIQRLQTMNYLVRVDGGATWVLEGESPLAVVERHRSEPHYIKPPGTAVLSLGKSLRFRYGRQYVPAGMMHLLS